MNIGITVRTAKGTNDIYCVDFLKDGQKTHGTGGFLSKRDALLYAAGDLKSMAGEWTLAEESNNKGEDS